jgi:hypothetical protein
MSVRGRLRGAANRARGAALRALSPGAITVPVQNIPAARALEVVQRLIDNPAGRADYKADPAGAFGRKKQTLPEPALRNANYGDIPPNARRALEGLSVPELDLLSRLDRTFVADGLYVQVPSPGLLFYK